MIRVHVICEGQSEEMFVNEVLAEHLLSRGLYLYPSRIGKPGHKGGNVRVERLLFDVRARLHDVESYCTTFFDFYGLPMDFPGRREAGLLTGVCAKARCVQDALLRVVTEKLGEDAGARFLPYVQMHEFEALLFSDPAAFAAAIGRPELGAPLQGVRDSHPTPEDINDGPNTAPSKRVLALHAGYDKVWHGSLAAIEMGLDAIRADCVLFHDWLLAVEGLGNRRRAVV
jgi:hypothetical protein